MCEQHTQNTGTDRSVPDLKIDMLTAQRCDCQHRLVPYVQNIIKVGSKHV